jgi:hypothetical protein
MSEKKRIKPFESGVFMDDEFGIQYGGISTEEEKEEIVEKEKMWKEHLRKINGEDEDAK